MNLTNILLITIGSLTILVAMLFLFFPVWCKQIQEKLNEPWGDFTIIALRTGLPGEIQLEEKLNQPVQVKIIVWDGWAERHPGITGTILLMFALVCWVLALV